MLAQFVLRPRFNRLLVALYVDCERRTADVTLTYEGRLIRTNDAVPFAQVGTVEAAHSYLHGVAGQPPHSPYGNRMETLEAHCRLGLLGVQRHVPGQVQRKAHVAEYIECVALSHPKWGKPATLPPPARYEDVRRGLIEQGRYRATLRFANEGFMTSTGRFVSRKSALLIAEKAHQIINKTAPIGVLHSEDMW